jgi:transcriptional regulator with XRE-family HTH domain
MSKLRAFLLKERGSRGWSLTDLSEKSGIAMGTLSRYQSPKFKGRPKHENILALARAFEIDPGEILRYIGYPRRPHPANGRDAEWEKLRELLEGDPRAKRLIELYDDATDEDRDLGVELLEVYFKKRPRRRRPPQ